MIKAPFYSNLNSEEKIRSCFSRTHTQTRINKAYQYTGAANAYNFFRNC